MSDTAENTMDTIDLVWASFEEVLRSSGFDAHGTALAKMCFFNGADAMLRLIVHSGNTGGFEAHRDMIVRLKAASCEFVLSDIAGESPRRTEARVN